MGRRVRSALVASGLGQWSIPPEVAAMAEGAWASMAATPGAVWHGGALAYTGRQPGLFALRGGTSQNYTLLSLVPAQDVGWTRWPPWLP